MASQDEVDDLAVRVDHLQAAVAAAGAILVDAGAGATGSTAARSGSPTSPAAKGIRTVLQIGLASIPGLGLGAALDSGLAAWAVTLVLAPLVAYVQNTLEDAHKLRAILRDVGEPPATPPAGHDLAP